MTDTAHLVVADEWHVTLLVEAWAASRSVRRWAGLTAEILAAAALAAESRLEPPTARARIRVSHGVERNRSGWPP